MIFAYPVYTFIAPSQLHRFIEMMKENGVNMRDKYVTQITTSKHFYDITAHRYIEDNMMEMGAKGMIRTYRKVVDEAERKMS